MGILRRLAAAGVIALGLALGLGPAHAQPVSARSPGPLTHSHAALDAPARCDACHVNGTRAVDAARCLGCHDHAALGARIAAGQGLHASPLVAGKPCETCHREHEGRAFDPMGWAAIPGGEGGLDHALTGWSLEGKHAAAACAACHPARDRQGLRVYRGADRACERCHAGDSRHGDRFAAFGRPAPACGACHPPTRWTPSAFDHSARTKFPLTGMHAVIRCRDCHRGQGPADFEVFGAQLGCKDCHAHSKVHADASHPDGKYTSAQCLNCHPVGLSRPPSSAQLLRIVHGPGSAFPLVKAHRAVPCADCHPGRTRAGKPRFDRESPECAARCHEDSLHRGALGARCTACHVPGTWDALRFDHDAATFPDGAPGYPLRGEHRALACAACHGPDRRSRRLRGTPRACAAAGCHAADDAHRGHLGAACERCHVETGELRFDHAASAFRLDGAHRRVPCADCHPSVTFAPRPRACAGCHPDPAAHRAPRGAACERCHTARTWAEIRPLHDAGGFRLAGQHAGLPCARCHRGGRSLAGTGDLCINCHRGDDIHGNSLSPRCGECHTQWSFAPARFDHGRAGCTLTGLHRTLACAACHRNGNYAAITAECAGCHLDDAVRAGPSHADPAHRTACATAAGCHHANSWSPHPAGHRESVCR